MADFDQFDVTYPFKTEYFKNIFSVLRARRKQFKERFELDHYMDGELDTTLPTADGYHKQLTMVEFSYINLLGETSDEPESISNAGIVFLSVDDDEVLCFKYKDQNGNTVKIA